ncbi:hypothetical protein NCCP28_44090 [Niallia sp. NCCP-28]|nr:hypothetical protein NCCP28_44090 [Niallia sp. NCCP-28]
MSQSDEDISFIRFFYVSYSKRGDSRVHLINLELCYNTSVEYSTRLATSLK